MEGLLVANLSVWGSLQGSNHLSLLFSGAVFLETGFFSAFLFPNPLVLCGPAQTQQLIRKPGTASYYPRELQMENISHLCHRELTGQGSLAVSCQGKQFRVSICLSNCFLGYPETHGFMAQIHGQPLP